MTTAAKKVLMVLTSHDELGNTGEKTGFWLEEFAAPYYVFTDAGIDVTLASPKGGQPPLDPKSELEDFQTDATRRFNDDKDAQQALASTQRLSEIASSDYDAVFYPGGHGPMWDLYEDAHSQALIAEFFAAGKAVATVCHAPAVLLNVKVEGEYLLKGKEVTGFSNIEESGVQLLDVVPYLLEDELQARGGRYKAGEAWLPFVIQDGLVITGQNPASSELTAEKLISAFDG